MTLRGLTGTIILVLAISACNTRNTRPDPSAHSPAEVNVELGLLYMQEGQKNVALEKFQKALEQDPNLPSAHNAIAVLYDNLGEAEKADSHYRRALSLDPENSQARNNYASFLCQSKRWADADENYMRAAANPLYETPWLSYTNAGTCAYMADDKEKAEKNWRKALETNPRYPPAMLQMVRLNVEQKKYLNARAYLQRLNEVIRPNAETLWLGILTERALGDKNAVASYSMRLKNGFPDSPQAKLLQE